MSGNPPEDAICVEDGCGYPATTTRPGTGAWLYDDGVITEYDEWVCAYHAPRGPHVHDWVNTNPNRPNLYICADPYCTFMRQATNPDSYCHTCGVAGCTDHA